MKPAAFQRYLPLVATGLVLVLLFTAAAVLFDRFASPRNVANILRNHAYLGVIAVGMTFVILSGGIDLSVGTLLGFTTILVARLVHGGVHPAAAMAVAIAVGTAFGAGQGFLIHAFRLPPFLVTLGGMFLAKGMAFVVHLQSLAIDHAWFSALAGFRFSLLGFGPLTTSTIVFLGVLLVAMAVAHETPFGRNVYAVGGAEGSAMLMGLPVGSTKIGVYALSGCCAAVGGIVYTLGTRSGNPAIGLGMELDAIACTVIGGTLLTGGSGFVLGTLLGVLIFGTLRTALDFHGGLDSSWLRIAMGMLLLLFIVLQRALARGAGRPHP